MSFIQNPVQIITRKIVTPNQDLDIAYPVVVGMANQAVQYRINHQILALVHKLIVDQGYYREPRTTIQGWYEVKTNERGVLSLSIGNYAYTYMAAHGLTVIKSLTFDVQSGKNYELSELFKPGSDYVKVLSDMIRVQIKERDIPVLDEFQGIAPDQDYYIADKCLVIYFQLYDITPYVFGFPFFPICVYKIQDIIRENSPLDKMAINS